MTDQSHTNPAPTESPDTSTSPTPINGFAALGLPAPVMTALADAGYTVPTPIQAQAIAPLLAGRDLLGLAETGTGKTAAFALPLLARLSAETVQPTARSARALILAPTRELAIQIGDSIRTYGRHLRLTHTVIFGGVGHVPQIKAMARGVDILVATPGRLLDLMDQRVVRLDTVSHLVLDEADRMLDMGFIRDVRRIVRQVPGDRQTLLFSATMPNDIADLAKEILRDPVRVEVARAGKTVDRIEQRVQFVDASKKRDVLNQLLADPAFERVIVFTRTKRGADRVARNLEQANIAAHAIHGNKSQGARQSALASFKSGRTRVLVATDIAARGIDIDDITHVINYELPNIPESYVHRIGRTARAGAAGVAIALCAPDEREYLRDIERLTKRALTVVGTVSGLDAPQTVDAAAERQAPRRDARHREAPRGPWQDRAEQRERPQGQHRRDGRGGRPDRADRPRHDRADQRADQRPQSDDRRGSHQARGDRPAWRGKSEDNRGAERQRGDGQERRPPGGDNRAPHRVSAGHRDHRPRHGQHDAQGAGGERRDARGDRPAHAGAQHREGEHRRGVHRGGGRHHGHASPGGRSRDGERHELRGGARHEGAASSTGRPQREHGGGRSGEARGHGRGFDRGHARAESRGDGPDRGRGHGEGRRHAGNDRTGDRPRTRGAGHASADKPRGQ
jgi:ATP-dependent RNA helicase RhlE